MYEAAPSQAVVDVGRARAATDFAGLVRELVAERRQRPADDLISDLAATELSEDEVVAAVVLLLNAGHEASVNVFGNGAVAMLRRGLRPGADVALTVEEMLRFDSALQLFERTATEPVAVGDVVVEAGQKIAALLGAANRDPAVFERARRLRRRPRPQPAPGLRGRRALLPRRAAGADGAGRVGRRAVRPVTRDSRWPASRRAGGRSCCGGSVGCR